ncbi:unnamed protein product [Urochloa humidicola]
MATGGGEVAAAPASDLGLREDGQEECSGLEPFFYEEAAVRAEHVAAEAAKEKLREEARQDRRHEAHRAVMNEIRDFDEKQEGY